jgi:hypothetical protein
MKPKLPLAALALSLLSSFILFAHFLRSMELPGMVAALLPPLLYAWRRSPVRRLLQLASALGALLWILVALEIGRARLAAGEPWLRMALILASVAALTLLPALVLEGKKSLTWFTAPRKADNREVGEAEKPAARRAQCRRSAREKTPHK